MAKQTAKNVEDAFDGFNLTEDSASGLVIAAPKAEPTVNKLPVAESDGKPQRMFGIRATRVDKFSTKRTRVLMTPAVCPRCRLDLADLNKLGAWDELDHEIKLRVTGAVAEHIRKVHDISEDEIIPENQLPTKWLGSKAEVKHA
jgi:hypothetical protein